MESFGNPTCAAEIVIPDKYKSTLIGDPFLLFASGIGDDQRLNLFHYYVRAIAGIAMERFV